MSDKLVYDCATGKSVFVDFTPEEIEQNAINANLPPVITPPTEIEELSNYILDVDFRVVMIEMGL